VCLICRDEPVENPEILNQVQHDKTCLSESARRRVKEYERQINPVRSKLPEGTADTQSYRTSNGVDRMVCKLYGLTKEEIKIVEDFSKE